MGTKDFFSKLYTFNGKNYLLPTPRKCPHCLGIVSLSVLGVFPGPISEEGLMIYLFLFQCHLCNEMFIGRYLKNNTEFYQDGKILRNKFFYPNAEFEKKVFPPEINAISSHFVEIYNQSAKAEHYGCIDIAGAGYRKATEFLIRDFAKKIHRKKGKEINATTATRNVINNFLQDFPELREAADAALDLGNDETHYLKNYKSYDLEDLKDFLEITVARIVSITKLSHFKKKKAELKKRKGFVPIKEIKQKPE